MTTPQISPLADPIDDDVIEVGVRPTFGNRVRVTVHTARGPQEVPGSVAAVTIHGDGRIEYHPDPVEPK